ncbi:MAG: hypothetical protein NOU37_08385 [Candidatus Brocadiales bacterium]|nr:hypothetical protein [Candidatus Bathyanammoxibius amoris]
MNVLLNSANIVVLAQNYNPSIASKDWLRDKNIIAEQATNFINTPLFSLFESQNFLLTVDENKLEVGLKVVNESNLGTLKQIVIEYVNKLPHTPYNAVGLNSSWNIKKPGEEDLTGLIKQKFLPESETKAFNDLVRGAVFPGSIIRYKDGDFAVKLTIDPIPSIIDNNVVVKEVIGRFNYHCDVGNVEHVKRRVAEVDEKIRRSKSVLKTLLEKG